ncbi:hypothetical protein RJ641_027506, partial [Dillenia turbinata]
NLVGITTLQRIGIGYGINVVAEHNLLECPNSIIPISVFLLVPQYCPHGLVEAFYDAGYLEFLYDQLLKILNLVYFVICGWRYAYKPIAKVADVGVQGDVEVANNREVIEETLVHGEHKYS